MPEPTSLFPTESSNTLPASSISSASPKKKRAPRRDSLERIIQFPTRELLEWIEGQAADHERNLTQEIIFRLKQAMKWEHRRGERGRFKKVGSEGEGK